MAPGFTLPSELQSSTIHMVGIKGTGMAALAEVLVRSGARVTGSDVPERFYTDALLERIGVVPFSGFSSNNVPESVDRVIHSAAYGPDNPEIREALSRGLPVGTYNEALGDLSRRWTTVAITGVHGKTSTTAIAGTILARTGLDATILVGSAVPSFAGAATLNVGSGENRRHFVVEACEYRRHFLTLTPAIGVITSIELDHTDYFRDLDDIMNAFVEFGTSLAGGGTLIYSADDENVVSVVSEIRSARPDLSFVEYGLRATGRYAVRDLFYGDGSLEFRLGTRSTPWKLAVPGEHMALNAAAAVAVVETIAARQVTAVPDEQLMSGVHAYRGSRRRSEIVAEVSGVTIVDDYGHHPTAIRKTLDGYRRFFPGRRLVVDFMSHTYTRSATLLPQFANAFTHADVLILNRIYASARETESAGITSERFATEIQREHGHVYYEPDFPGAADRALAILKEGDVFITMGAGDNFRVGEMVRDRLAGKRP